MLPHRLDLKKKREEIDVVSCEGKKTPKDHCLPKVILELPITPIKLAKVIQIVPLQSTKILPSLTNMPLLQITNVHPRFIKILLHFTKFHPPITKMLLPTVTMCSRATEHPLLSINSKIQYTKIPSRTSKLHHQITKQIHIPKSKIPIQIPEVINRYPLHNKAL